MKRDNDYKGDFLPRLGAGCLVFIGLFIGVMAVSVGILERPILGVLVFAVLALAFISAGVYWYRYASSVDRRRHSGSAEKAMLAVAARHHGFATVAQLALETPYSVAECESILEQLCRQGAARPEILDDGTIRYRFGGLRGDPPRELDA